MAICLCSMAATKYSRHTFQAFSHLLACGNSSGNFSGSDRVQVEQVDFALTLGVPPTVDIDGIATFLTFAAHSAYTGARSTSGIALVQHAFEAVRDACTHIRLIAGDAHRGDALTC
jgi:hypothetical protein